MSNRSGLAGGCWHFCDAEYLQCGLARSPPSQDVLCFKQSIHALDYNALQTLKKLPVFPVLMTASQDISTDMNGCISIPQTDLLELLKFAASLNDPQSLIDYTMAKFQSKQNETDLLHFTLSKVKPALVTTFQGHVLATTTVQKILLDWFVAMTDDDEYRETHILGTGPNIIPVIQASMWWQNST